MTLLENGEHHLEHGELEGKRKKKEKGKKNITSTYWYLPFLDLKIMEGN
jgi:hypothetical protein